VCMVSRSLDEYASSISRVRTTGRSIHHRVAMETAAMPFRFVRRPLPPVTSRMQLAIIREAPPVAVSSLNEPVRGQWRKRNQPPTLAAPPDDTAGPVLLLLRLQLELA